MREIKFRAKRIDNGEWVYGHYFVTPLTDENSGVRREDGWIFLSDGVNRHCIEQDHVVYVIDEKTLGQFTGLFDKNGKEIWEGDVCVTYKGGLSSTEIVYPDLVVVWERDGYRWARKSKETGEFITLFRMGDPSMDVIEIIGNIYENPELLS